MGNRKTIPIAYVTKWATTVGIRVIRDAEVSEGGYLHTGFISVSQANWTEDRVVAEGRWRKAVASAAASAEKKAARLRASLAHAPKYDASRQTEEG